MSKIKIRKVLVFCTVGRTSGREHLNGVFRYIDAGHPWQLVLVHEPDAFLPDVVRNAEKEGIDGMIVTLPPEKEMRAALIESPIPAVFTNVFDPDLSARSAPTVHVRSDDMEIGRKGAEFLAGLGKFASFAFVHALRHRHGFSEYRAKGFATGLKRLDIEFVQEYTAGQDEGSPDELARLGEWLTTLPKPSAVMVACDWRAKQVLNAAHSRNIRIPGQISVLGVDNDELEAVYSHPPLSSIHPGHSDMGYAECVELERLMNGGRKFREILVPPKRIVVRESTSFVKPSTLLVERASRFLEGNALLGATTADVVAHLGCSRALADMRFKEITGMTIHAALEKRRLDEVCRLLKNTRRSVIAIASQCGFRSAGRLSHLFKQRFGVSIREWRKAGSTP